MGWALVLVSLVVGEAGQGAERDRLLLTRFRGSNTLMQRVADSLTDALAERLDRAGTVQRTGPMDVVELPGQQPLDAWQPGGDEPRPPGPCGTEDGPCLARAATGHRVRWLLVGHVVGGSQPRRVDVQLVRVPEAEVAWRTGLPPAGASAAELALGELVLEVLAAQGFGVATVAGVPTVEAPAAPPSLGPRATGWVVAGVGAGVAAAGCVLFALAAATLGRLDSAAWRATQYPFQVLAETNAFNATSTAAYTVLGVGYAAIAAGLFTVLFNPDGAPPPVTLAPGRGGVLVQGTW